MRNLSKSELIDEYIELRTKIDVESEGLNTKHAKNMQCKAGCDSCCESIRVFPIEFDAIKKELGSKLETMPRRLFNKFRKSCGFLKNGECSIYGSRPIICRTQGLPLLYQSADGVHYELSVCQLNFKGIKPDQFNMDNALYMPKFNSELFLLNQNYAQKLGLSNHKRIALYELLK